MKHRMETLQGLRYKLIMMGVPVSGPSYIYWDNMSVIHNTQCPEFTLRGRNNSIFYHTMRESVAMGELLMTHIPKNDNPLNLMMKVLAGQNRRNFVSNFLYDIYDEHHFNRDNTIFYDEREHYYRKHHILIDGTEKLRS